MMIGQNVITRELFVDIVTGQLLLYNYTQFIDDLHGKYWWLAESGTVYHCHH